MIASIALLAGLSGLLKIVVFFVILGVLVTAHELGHFVVAKRAGITVDEFAFGFGPALMSVEYRGTQYRINLLPIGGYCKMRGEDAAGGPGSSTPAQAVSSDDPSIFPNKPVWVRFGVILAGPVFNFILAALIFAIIGLAIGMPTQTTNVVAQVAAGSPAAAADLRSGDEIVSLDNQPVRSGLEMVNYIHGRPNTMIAVGIVRAGKPLMLHIRTRADRSTGKLIGVFGFIPKTIYQRMGIWSGIGFGFAGVRDTIYLQVTGIAGAIAHHDSSGFHGPVGIARLVIENEGLGIAWMLNISAALSVVLGFFNLLPWPALDGGRLVFLLVEAVRGRPVPPEKEGLVHLTGFALLMVLVIFITYRDIMQWVTGQGGL